VWRRTVLLVAGAVLAADQVSKSTVLDLVAHQRRDGGAPTIRLVRNTGASLGIGAGHPLLITGVAIAVTVFVAIFTFRTKIKIAAIGGAVALGGAAGNLADRIFRAPAFGRGAVIDWIHIHWYSPSFNIADLAVRAGGIIAVASLLLAERKRKRRAYLISAHTRDSA
jgi:signal peptidase II